jgi:hypothetical protein
VVTRQNGIGLRHYTSGFQDCNKKLLSADRFFDFFKNRGARKKMGVRVGDLRRCTTPPDQHGTPLRLNNAGDSAEKMAK